MSRRFLASWLLHSPHIPALNYSFFLSSPYSKSLSHPSILLCFRVSFQDKQLSLSFKSVKMCLENEIFACIYFANHGRLSPATVKLEVLWTYLADSAIHKVLFTSFPVFLALTCCFVFPLCPSDFYICTAWFAGAWWICLRLPVKRRVPITHPSPLIAQSAFDSSQIRPECTSSRIQLNCLNRHSDLAWVCSNEFCHNGEFYSRPCALPPSQCCSGSELFVKDEGYVEPAAANVAVGSGQKAMIFQGWKCFWDVETDEPQIKGLLWNLQ